MKYLPLGLILSGERDPALRVPMMLGALVAVDSARADKVAKNLKWDDPELAQRHMLRVLNDYAPPYCYVGEQEGNLGVWVDVDGVHADGIQPGGAVLKIGVGEPGPEDVSRYDYIARVDGNGGIVFHDARTGKELWRHE